MLTFEAPWTTRNTWGAPHIFFRHPHGLISDRVQRHAQNKIWEDIFGLRDVRRWYDDDPLDGKAVSHPEPREVTQPPDSHQSRADACDEPDRERETNQRPPFDEGPGREGGSFLPSGAAAPHVELSVEMRRATTPAEERGGKCSRGERAADARLFAHGSDPHLVRIEPCRSLGRHPQPSRLSNFKIQKA